LQKGILVATDLMTFIPTAHALPAWGRSNDADAARVEIVQDRPNVTTSTIPHKDAAASVHPDTGAATMTDRDADQELVLRVQQGDKRAFELLVVKYHRKIVRLLSRMIRDQSEIEDVAQEAFIKAYRALPAFRGESAFYTWLYRIAINTAKNHLAAFGRRPTLSTEYEDEDGERLDSATQVPDLHTPESELMNRQIVTTVNEAVDALPEELRTAITLREMDGLSYEDIAAVMNCPIGTVRSRIFRAREAIAARLRPLIDTAGKGRRW
jgi:RNA polymerase sigma-70 factor (ECF subfamily)